MRSQSAQSRSAAFAFARDFGKIAGMAFDPKNPPIWLRKLHVSAAQISPTDYPPTPGEGLLLACQLSDAHLALAKAFAAALFPHLPHEETQKHD